MHQACAKKNSLRHENQLFFLELFPLKEQNQRKIQYQIGECVAHNLREFTARQDAGVIPEAYIFHGIHGHQKIIIHQAEYG